jgi:hypothetical protein
MYIILPSYLCADFLVCSFSVCFFGWDVHNTVEHLLIPLITSICLYALNNSGVAGQIFMKFNIGEFYKELCSHFSSHGDQKILMTTLHEDLDSFPHMSQA